MSEEITTPFSHELRAVHNEITKRIDLVIKDLKTNEEQTLPCGDYDSAVFFEVQLEKILGGEKIFLGLYRENTRPQITQEAHQRLLGAYANSAMHC